MVGWDARDDCISGADAKKATYVAFGDDEVASKIDDMVAAKKKSLADEGRSETDTYAFYVILCEALADHYSDTDQHERAPVIEPDGKAKRVQGVRNTVRCPIRRYKLKPRN